MKEQNCMEQKRNYITYRQGAEKYSMSINSFKKYAREAHAIIPLGDGSITLVDDRVFETYLESLRK